MVTVTRRLQHKLEPSARTFHAMGNISRLFILYMVAREPMEFGQLVRRIKLSPSLLSHHLKLLMKAGLVTKTKFGKLATYYLAEDAVKEIGRALNRILSPQSESN